MLGQIEDQTFHATDKQEGIKAAITRVAAVDIGGDYKKHVDITNHSPATDDLKVAKPEDTLSADSNYKTNLNI